MPGLRIHGFRKFAIRTLPLLLLAFLCGAPITQGQTNANTSNSPQNETSFQLKVSSNLVVVRAVVRDAQGKPVENLKKADFKLFDRGREQSITQFEVVASAPPTPAPNSVVARKPGQAASATVSAVPGKFIAFYFDDLNTSDADMIQARDAADHYLAANLQPQDRVAIFTLEEMLSDFTADTKQIHKALFKLQASARSLAGAHYCPDLSDYQALQITENNQEALGIAMDEAAHCEGGVLMPPGGVGAGSGGAGSGPTQMGNSGGGGIAAIVIRGLARNIVNQAQAQARVNLHQLQEVVKHISQMHGQRTVILVSPGFISQDEQFQLDRLIDQALRLQVVVSALDPKGLAVLMREADASRSYIPINPSMLESAKRLDSLREWVAIGVLKDIAQGTGGEFFHNSNDLKAGFGALAGSPAYYILTFAPKDIKKDGKFHELKVTLTEKEKGFSIQARRGYFASKNGAEPPDETQEAQATPREVSLPETPQPQPKPLETKPTEAPSPEVQAQAQIQAQLQQAVLSKADLQQFPVALDVKLSAAQGETHELSVNAHLDATPLHFHKEGEHNLNTVTFIFAVFDQQDTLLNAQQRRAKVDVIDAELPNLVKAGVNVNATFQLKSGSYRLREVVTDSEDHSMTALSRNIQVP